MVPDADEFDTIEIRRIGVFLLVAFAVSWTVGAYIYLTGGLEANAVMLRAHPSPGR